MGEGVEDHAILGNHCKHTMDYIDGAIDMAKKLGIDSAVESLEQARYKLSGVMYEAYDRHEIQLKNEKERAHDETST